MAVVQRWIDARRVAGIRNGTLFCTLAGGEDERPVRPPCSAASAPPQASRRGFTRTACADSHTAELAAGNVPLNVISHQFGHANRSVTVRYFDHIAPSTVIETIQRRRWAEPCPQVRFQASTF